jgi:hypothetical protein
MNGRRLAGLAGLLLADLCVLVAARPHPSALSAGVAAPRDWVAGVGVDGALGQLAGAALWSAAVWLAVGMAAASATHLPGAFGRVGELVACALLPRTVYRLVAGSAGLGILIAPVAAGASVAGPAPVATAAANAVAESTPASTSPPPAPIWPLELPMQAVPAPTWPLLPTPSAHRAPGAGAATSASPSAVRPTRPASPTRPVSPPQPTSPRGPASPPQPTSPRGPASPPTAVVTSPPQSPPPPSTSPNRPQAPPPARQSATPHLPAVEPRSQTVRVRPGDSLWLIAARRVGPAPAPAKVAAEWPRWYARNRTIIGPDPSLLLPGQQLTAPDGARPGATP